MEGKSYDCLICGQSILIHKLGSFDVRYLDLNPNNKNQSNIGFYHRKCQIKHKIIKLESIFESAQIGNLQYFVSTIRTLRQVKRSLFSPVDCFFCGESIIKFIGRSSESITSHHIDWNRDNNDPLNITFAHCGCHQSYHQHFR